MLLLAGDILRRTARRFPRKTAIVCGDRQIDYAGFDAAANRFAQALVRGGVARGDVIGIISPNLLEYAVVFYGAARVGAVLANLNTRSTAPEAARVLKLAEPRLVVAEAGLAPLIRDAIAEGAPPCRVIAFGAGADAAGAETLDQFIADAPATEPGVTLAEDDPLGLTFTGGTTGMPKGVLVSHRGRGMSALTCIVDFDLNERDIAAVSTPLFHAAGLFVWMHPAVMIGARMVFLPRWDCEIFMAEVARQGITAAVLVPTQLNDLVKHPAFDPKRLRSLRKINHAGMPMPIALIDRVCATMPWVELTDNYGSSESGPITARRHYHLPAKASSVGLPAFNVEVEVRDAEGRTLPPGEVGEVVTRGDHLMLGYYKDPDGTAAVFKSGDGWFWTGDLGYVDDDGFVVLVDRAKDVVVQGGENIFPLEIENALYQHPAVLECAVVGMPDERLGEVPAANVVLRPGMAATADDLVEFCLARIARHKRPRLIKFVEALPKTAVGKIQKHRIRAEYWAGRERRI